MASVQIVSNGLYVRLRYSQFLKFNTMSENTALVLIAGMIYASVCFIIYLDFKKSQNERNKDNQKSKPSSGKGH